MENSKGFEALCNALRTASSTVTAQSTPCPHLTSLPTPRGDTEPFTHPTEHKKTQSKARAVQTSHFGVFLRLQEGMEMENSSGTSLRTYFLLLPCLCEPQDILHRGCSVRKDQLKTCRALLLWDYGSLDGGYPGLTSPEVTLMLPKEELAWDISSASWSRLRIQ